MRYNENMKSYTDNTYSALGIIFLSIAVLLLNQNMNMVLGYVFLTASIILNAYVVYNVLSRKKK
jgi:hypothetical protein